MGQRTKISKGFFTKIGIGLSNYFVYSTLSFAGVWCLVNAITLIISGAFEFKHKIFDPYTICYIKQLIILGILFTLTTIQKSYKTRRQNGN